MGNSSSQIDQEPEQRGGPQVAKSWNAGNNEDADAASTAGSNRSSGTNNTTASRALARDLERSVMESSQGFRHKEPPKKRQKRKRAQSRTNADDQALEDGSIIKLTKDIASEQDLTEAGNKRKRGSAQSRQRAADKDTETRLIRATTAQTKTDGSRPNGNAEEGSDEDGSSRRSSVGHETTRKHLVRDLRRWKKTVLVNSGKAKWAPRINGTKWEVEKLPEAQWVDRELTTVEKEVLEKLKAKVKDAKARLVEFDRGANEVPAGKGPDKGASEIEVEGESRVLQATSEEVKRQIGPRKQADASMQHDEVETPSRQERKGQKKAQRKMKKNGELKTEDLEETVAPMDLDPPEPEPAYGRRSQKQRKLSPSQTMTSSPPLPTTNTAVPPLHSVAGKHKTELVKSWLNSQDLLEEMEEGSAHEIPARSKSSAKRGRASNHQVNDNDDYQTASGDDGNANTADSEDELPTLRPAAVNSFKDQRSKNSGHSKVSQKEAPSCRPPAALAQRSAGPFTKEEKSVVDGIFDQVLRNEGIDEAALKRKICAWGSVGTFKDEVEAALPLRNKTSIRKFCQRRYHMLARGPWTAEEDEDLRNAQLNYPDQWSKHKDLVGRTAADCKDRWTLHLQYCKTTGAWTQDEEAALIVAVERAIDTIKNDSATKPAVAADSTAIENALSWKLIAKDLDNTRTNRQCREKWNNLKLREARGEVKPGGRSLPHDRVEMTARKKAAKHVVRRFELGDFYDILCEIHTSFPDTSSRFYNEENTIWSTISLKNPASRFNLAWNSGHIRRTALNHAVQEWNIDSKKVRRRLEKSETPQAKAKVLAELLEKSYAGRTHSMARNFMPELVGKTKEEILQCKSDKKRAFADKMRAKQDSASAGQKASRYRSKEFVNDETDEEGEEEEEADQEDSDVNPATLAADEGDEAEEESDISRNEEEQSAYQRRLDAQINGREVGAERAGESREIPSSIGWRAAL